MMTKKKNSKTKEPTGCTGMDNRTMECAAEHNMDTTLQGLTALTPLNARRRRKTSVTDFWEQDTLADSTKKRHRIIVGWLTGVEHPRNKRSGGKGGVSGQKLQRGSNHYRDVQKPHCGRVRTVADVRIAKLTHMTQQQTQPHN